MSSVDQIQSCIDRLHANDDSAREDLITTASHRLNLLTRTMLRDFPGVHRWEETDDVFQNATLRLCSALKTVKPRSVREFFGLASLQIRRELISLARHYFGPQGHGAHHASDANSVGLTRSTPRFEASQTTHEPSRLAMWSEFHSRVDELADDERAVFDLLWYQGLTQVEAAALLGVTERTIQRRWQQARINVYKAMQGNLPGVI